MGEWTAKKVYYLAVMTVGYIFGEIAHFLINTSSRAVAKDVAFGDLACYRNTSYALDAGKNVTACNTLKAETPCQAEAHCEWNYSGLGLQYQLLAGPSFIAVFTICSVCVGVAADNIKAVGRHRIMAAGVALFSTCCLLMGLANAFWQLVILRMGIAAGVAFCRPTAGGIIADLFSPSARGLANGIFSWGVYYGYGLAFVIGIYLTQADLLGYSWRASYVLSALPGLVMAVLLFFTLSDPWNDRDHKDDQESERKGHPAESKRERFLDYLRILAKSFLSPTNLLLLLAACVRHTAGYCWAYNTRTYFQTYYPTFDLGLWVFSCSIGGGSFGVFFGGYLSDKVVARIGLHSRLWVLSVCTLLATPFAIGTLYFPPPYAFMCLMAYYFCAETWFAILFTVIVEICAPEVKSVSIALFLFIMNNIGGNLPVIVDPISKAIGYREAVYFVWPGCVFVSSFLFFVASIPLWMQSKRRNNA